MALYGAFSNSVLGMMSQAHALHNIGTNVANVNTGGFKRTDTGFSTVLSRSMEHISDIGGVRPQDVSTIAQQGNIVASTSATDVAIAGRGFFVLNTQQDGSGDDLYTRDGSFALATVNEITVSGIGGTDVTTKDGYLVDKNGYFVQGWPYVNGSVTTTGEPQSLRVDQYAFSDQFEASTTGALGLNLSSSDDVGDTRVYDITMIDSAGDKQSDQLTFTKTDVNTWSVTHTTSQDPVAQVDEITIDGTGLENNDVYNITINGTVISYTTTGAEGSIGAVQTAIAQKINNNSSVNSAVTATVVGGVIQLEAKSAGTAFSASATATDGGSGVPAASASSTTTTANVTNTQTTAATTLTFDNDGTISTPETLNLALNFAGGTTATMTLDISEMTQFASEGSDLNATYSRDGYASSSMQSFSFDAAGNIIGVFEDSTYREIYQLALGVFSNPNALDTRNGNVFSESSDSGEVTLTAAGSNGYASISPNARELSNVDIAEEFTKMMTTQTAYNASSTVFKTTDEMTTVARDLKR